jgi:hypothetical protein
MWYVGSRTRENCHPDDGYICSSKVVRPLIEDKRSEWKREIIATGSSKDILNFETIILKALDAKNDPMSFNRTNNVFSKANGSIKGKKRIFLGDHSICVLPNELPLFLDSGWQLGWSPEHRQKFKDAAPDYQGEKNPMYGVSRKGHMKGHVFSDEQLSKFYKLDKKRECEHCGKVVRECNYARWHGEKCKHKAILDSTVLSKELGASELNEQSTKGKQ